MSNTIFVTGASGFLGRAVVNAFKNAGFDVIAVESVRKFSTLPEWKEYIEDSIDRSMPKAVVNIGACQANGDEASDIVELTTSNVIAPAIIASKLSRSEFNTQMLTISTSWQYGPSGEYRPFNLYAASKQALDDYLEHYAIGGLVATSLILFDTFSRDDKRRKIHRLIAEALEKNEVLEMTAGEQVLNLVHVDDAASAVLRAFELRSRELQRRGTLVKWAIKSTQSIQVKDLLEHLSDEKRALLKLGGRPYRSREIFEIWDGFELIPTWTEQKNKSEELRIMFNSSDR